VAVHAAKPVGVGTDPGVGVVSAQAGSPQARARITRRRVDPMAADAGLGLESDATGRLVEVDRQPRAADVADLAVTAEHGRAMHVVEIAPGQTVDQRDIGARPEVAVALAAPGGVVVLAVPFVAFQAGSAADREPEDHRSGVAHRLDCHHQPLPRPHS